jgi:hypothetical protein
MKVTVLFGFLTASIAAAAADLHYASSGGDWRSMVANMGMANAMYQAGVLSNDSSLLRSVSGVSGSSWFATQFFYSESFFQKTATTSPTNLADFVRQWMNAYKTIVNVPNTSACDFMSGTPSILSRQVLENNVAYCNAFVYIGADWANFTSSMLNAASQLAYKDGGAIASTPMDVSNRVRALQQTDLYIQLSLASSSRVITTNNNATMSTNVYVGEVGDLYTIPLATQYAVQSNGTGFNVVSTQALTMYTVQANRTFTIDDYSSSYLYPGAHGQVLVNNSIGAVSSGPFNLPFNATTPTVGQIAGASSAVLSLYSGLVPTTLAQFLSLQRLLFPQLNTALLALAANQLYNDKLAYELSVCSQWPQPCGLQDARFMDGGFTDDTSLALSVGKWQEANMNTALQVISLNANTPFKSFLMLFNTEINQGVEPGGFLWGTNVLPIRSPQIFATTLMNESALLNHTTVVNYGPRLFSLRIAAVTCNNTAFGVRAGQKVDILFINHESQANSTIISPSDIDQVTPLLAAEALEIASSAKLVETIQRFVGLNVSLMPSVSPMSGSAAPVSAPTLRTPKSAGRALYLQGVFILLLVCGLYVI